MLNRFSISLCQFLFILCDFWHFFGSGLEGEAALSGSAGAEVVSQLHLEAVRLTEFVILNVEALRKIVKKMDKPRPEVVSWALKEFWTQPRQCGTSYQKIFVEKSLKKSPLATKASDQPFNGVCLACLKKSEKHGQFPAMPGTGPRVPESPGRAGEPRADPRASLTSHGVRWSWSVCQALVAVGSSIIFCRTSSSSCLRL